MTLLRIHKINILIYSKILLSLAFLHVKDYLLFYIIIRWKEQRIDQEVW